MEEPRAIVVAAWLAGLASLYSIKFFRIKTIFALRAISSFVTCGHLVLLVPIMQVPITHVDCGGLPSLGLGCGRGRAYPTPLGRAIAGMTTREFPS